MEQDEVRETTSMDDTIRETLKTLNTDAPETKEPEAKEPAEAKEPEAKEPKEARARDESGRFKAKEPAAPEQASQAEDIAQASPEAAAETLTLTTGQPIDINRAPASWKPAAKAIWNTLPEPVRQEVYRREADFLNGNKGIKESADFGQSIRGVVEPYRMLIESEGGTPEKAISDLLRTAAVLRVGSPQQKLQALLGADQQFGVGLERYFAQRFQQPQGQQQAMQPFQQFQDPRVDQIMASLQANERARAQQEEAVSNSATERFIASKDEKGAPLYPFVDNVLDDMVERVQGIRRANPSANHEDVLKQAYEAACWANPEVRQVLIGQQQAKQQANEANLRKAEAAKRASQVNLPKRGSLPAQGAVGTMDDTIKETYRALTG